MAAEEEGYETTVTAEQREHDSAQQKQKGELQKMVQVVTHAVQELFSGPAEGEAGRVSFVARVHDLALDLEPRLKNAVCFISANAVHWLCQGGPWRAFLITAVGIISFAALAAVVAFALLLLTSTMNAAMASFLMSVSMVGVFMAFFFSSVTVIYVGALGFGGLTISSIAFLSVCAVIFFSGWIAITWVIWQGLRKCFQVARRSVALAGTALFSISAAPKDTIIQSQGAVFHHKT